MGCSVGLKLQDGSLLGLLLPGEVGLELQTNPDLFASTNQQRIHNALTAAGWAGPFNPVAVSIEGQQRTICVGSDLITPASVRTEEAFSRFGKPRRSRRRAPGFARERTTWVWKMAINFNEAVSTEAFETLLEETPIYLPATATLPQVILRLDFSNIQHPAQQDPANGTKITYTFSAQVAPQ